VLLKLLLNAKVGGGGEILRLSIYQETTMQTYNALIRLNAKLENEVSKEKLTAPEVLLMRKIHGDDAVVKIVENGVWEDHFSIQTIKDYEGKDEQVEAEYDDDVEKDRLARIYGEAIRKEEDGGNSRNAIDRMFGEFAPLPSELPDFKKARKAAAAKEEAAAPKAKNRGNLDKVA
jgi:hypothetical protein